MNKDIKIMTELQRYWDKILLAQKEMERCRKNIVFWETEIIEKENLVKKTGKEIKNTKALVKDKELILARLDERIKMLENRRMQLKTEKEVEALDHELAGVKSEDGEIEEQLLELLDQLELMENNYSVLQEDMEEKRINAAKSIEKLNEDILTFEKLAQDNKTAFDGLVPSLQASHQGRFMKLLQSKGGKAVGEVHGETCSNCNFQIPSHLALDASKADKIVNCTNCGRYIYRQ